MYVGTRGIGDISLSSAQFCCDSKTTLNNRVYQEKKSDNTEVGKDQRNCITTAGGNVKWYRHNANQQQFLKKLNMQLPYDPAMLSWACIPEKCGVISI